MILLKYGTYIDWQSLQFRQTDILVEEGPGGKIRLGKDWKEPADAQTIDCSGKFITKSFANAHHHAYSALATGMNPPEKKPGNFLEILQFIWWKLDKTLDPEIIRSSALATAIACARNGVTFVIDHHASPMAIDGSLELTADAFDQVGVGHLLCYEISDRDGRDKAREGLEETARYLAKRQGLVGLHASFTVGDDILLKAVDLALKTNSGIHIHAAEDKHDQEDCLKRYGKRVINRLSYAGVLQFPKTILAHCLHLNDKERSLVRESPVWIAENMESNLNNAVGFFNSGGLGSKIMIGTDGLHSDMLQSARAAYFAGRHWDGTDQAESYRRLRNVHHYLQNNGFNGDGENNLVVLDYPTPTPLNSGNFLGHFLFGIESKHTIHVISNGKLIVRDRKILTVSEDEILAEAKIQAERLWKNMR